MRKAIGILAGGLSRRMGRKKEFLPLDDSTMLEHVMRRIHNLDIPLYLSVSRTSPMISHYVEEFQGLNVVIDVPKFNVRNPLVGLYTLLTSIDEDCLIVIAGDSPLVSGELMSYESTLCEKGFLAVLPIWVNGKVDPVHAAYSREIADDLESMLKEDPWISAARMIGNIDRVAFVGVEDFGWSSVVDVDTPIELGYLIRIYEGRD